MHARLSRNRVGSAGTAQAQTQEKFGVVIPRAGQTGRNRDADLCGNDAARSRMQQVVGHGRGCKVHLIAKTADVVTRIDCGTSASGTILWLP